MGLMPDIGLDKFESIGCYTLNGSFYTPLGGPLENSCLNYSFL